MTSGEYLKQLEKYLRKLPQSDYEDAMEYFTEYFADAGPENEQAVIKELGTPKQAAAELMRNLLDKKVDEREAMEKEEKQKEKKKTTGANVVWIAILALFAAPIGAPILISILIVLLCAALCAALLDMSVFLIAVVGVAAGIKMLLRGILAVSVSFGGFCFITGMGVFMLGISILCAVFGVYFAKWMGRLFVWCTRMFSGWASGGKAYAETYDLNAMSGSAKKEDGISTQEKIKLDDFDELQADLTIGDLNILPSGDDSCYLAWRIPSKKGETAVEYRVRDGVLSIEETSAVSDTIYINIDFTEEILSGGKQSETGVILYVPEKKVLKKIEVTMGFGDVQMNGIQAESGRLQNADGDITLFGCDMQNIKCKADYGDVELKSGTWENGSITLEDGDAKIQNTKLSGDVSVENSYGDIELELGKKDLERLEITAKTDFGEIDVPDTMENLMQKEEDEQSFSYVPDQPAGRITLMTKDGDISLEND